MNVIGKMSVSHSDLFLRTISAATNAVFCNLTLFLQTLVISELSLKPSTMCMQQALFPVVRALRELLAAVFLSSA